MKKRERGSGVRKPESVLTFSGLSVFSLSPAPLSFPVFEKFLSAFFFFFRNFR